MRLKVMTYNIASGYNNEKPRIKNYDHALNVINDFMPDIVSLNEVGKEPPKGISSQAGYLGEKSGMNSFFAKAIDVHGFPYGNALLSKYPIVNARIVPIPDPTDRSEKGYYETRCLLVAEIQAEMNFTVMISHFGLVRSEQVNAVATVLSELDKTASPVIFMGDLNMERDNELLVPIYARLTEVDACMNALRNTFPSDKPVKKIDYIFTSSHFKTDTVFSPVTLASDHCPLCAFLSNAN